MEEHIGEYIEETGKPLGKSSDQTVENCHQWLNKRLTKSGYYCKVVETEENGEKFSGKS